MGEGETQQVLWAGLGLNRRATDLLVTVCDPQVQAEAHKAKADDHTDEEAQTAGQIVDCAYKKEGGEEGLYSLGEGADFSQHRREDRGVADDEVKEWSVQGYL
jgi:hypothetical protein